MSYIDVTDEQILKIRNGAQSTAISFQGTPARIGIGVDAPSYPLEIASQTSTSLSGGKYFNASSSVLSTVPSSTTFNISIKASNGILIDSTSSGSFVTSSDSRIKQDVECLDPARSLDLICRLKPCRFSYIESGDSDIGFIAQEVASVLPEAVSKDHTKFIPSIYRIGHIKDNVVHVCSPHGMETNKVLRLQVMTLSGSTMILENVRVHDDTSFSFEPPQLCGMELVFIYGHEVNDFHILSKEQIYTLSVSAIQKLNERISVLESSRT